MSASTSSKASRLIVKYGSASAWLGEADWRGIIALTLVAGYIALLIQRVEGVEVFGVAVGLVVGRYFGNRRLAVHGQTRLMKFPLATEKSPQVRSIKTKLMETLQRHGQFEGAADELLVNEIAKTVVDIRTVDEKVDAAENLELLRQAWGVKAAMVKTLQNTLEQLALSRRMRMKKDDAAAVRDTFEARIAEYLARKDRVE